MNTEEKKIVGKAMVMALRTAAGITPVGTAVNSIIDIINEINDELEKEKIKKELTALATGEKENKQNMNRLKERLTALADVLKTYDEKLTYYLEEYSDEISYEFSGSLKENEVDKFIELLAQYDIPLESGDFYDDMDGISLHLGEGNGLTEYEISKVGRKLDEILKEIAPNLSIESAGRIDKNGDDVSVRL